MLTEGFFEIKGTRDELLKKLSGGTLKSDGVIYFANFGDGTIKVGMTRGAKGRVNTFDKTIDSYGKIDVIRFGVSPIISNQREAEKKMHILLAPYFVERELFRVSEEMVENAVKMVKMNVLRSCMWPACKGYFNHYGKESVRIYKTALQGES